MFTGLIEEIGKVEQIIPVSKGKDFRISGIRVLEDLAPDDSVSVSGVCLTVTKVKESDFETTAMEETLQKSTLKRVKIGDKVNLERAMQLSDRLGGHIVQGHVDGVGRIVSAVDQGTGRVFEIEIPEQLSKYTIEKGSIAIDGISLTIARVDGRRIRIYVIPHTLEKTTMQFIQPGNEVNIEVDFFGKYIERFLQSTKQNKKMGEARLRSLGY